MSNEHDSIPLKSEFQDDPDMADIVEIFLDELPSRISSLEDALQRGDIEMLQQLAHQLRGVGAGYGFPLISETGAQLEDCIREQRPTSEIRQFYDCLHLTCTRALRKAS